MTGDKLVMAAVALVVACSPSTQPDCRPRIDRDAVVESRQLYMAGAQMVRAVMTTDGELITVRDDSLFKQLRPGTTFHIDCKKRGRYELSIGELSSDTGRERRNDG